jgi:hypothetical protein
MTTRLKTDKPKSIPSNVDTSVAIADVPVKIRFLHGDETLQEYEDVINVEFDTKTSKGIACGRRLLILKMQGYSTEEAIFTIASDQVHNHAEEILQSLAGTKLLNRAAGHEIRLSVARNGEITFKMPFKD